MTCNGFDIRFVVATSFIARLRGLLGTSQNWRDGGCALLIPHCSSVHTFGMRYALDIAFVDEHGVTLRSERNVIPGRLLSCSGAAFVLERPHDAHLAWFAHNARLSLSTDMQLINSIDSDII